MNWRAAIFGAFLAVLVMPALAQFFNPPMYFGGGSSQVGNIALDPANAVVDIVSTNTTSGLTSAAFVAGSSNELIVAVVNCGGNSAPPTVTSVSNPSGTALTWTQRSSKINGNFINTIWYAKASGTFNSKVAATYSGTCGDVCIAAFGIKNYNTTNVWDANASLPAYTTGSSSLPTVGPISTSSADTMLLSLEAGTGVSSNTLTGWTTVPGTGLSNVGGCCNCAGVTHYKIVSATQSNLSGTYGTSTTTWITTGDAVVSN